MVNDFSAIDALPSHEMFLNTVKLLLDHNASTATTLHRRLQYSLIPLIIYTDAVVLFPMLLISPSPRPLPQWGRGEE